MKWNAPLDDGGAPIDHYLVEKLDTETGRWLPAMKTKEPKAEIENLVPGHEYKFRVSAVNNEGVSEPLEGEQSIIAKNPFGMFMFLNVKIYSKPISCKINKIKYAIATTHLPLWMTRCVFRFLLKYSLYHSLIIKNQTCERIFKIAAVVFEFITKLKNKNTKLASLEY